MTGHSGEPASSGGRAETRLARCRSAWPRAWVGLSLALISLLVLAVVLPLAAMAAPTTTITVRKLAADGNTVLVEKTVDYRWLMDPRNVPVLGDGITHYYHQGPVFVSGPDETTEQALRWNPAEDANTKDMGALKGTNVQDLCELVGGMAEGDRLKVKASDGLSRTFAYNNVCRYSDREGPMVICWHKDGQLPDSGYDEGMRLVWFADTSTNPWGQHVFGNWDWHEAAEERSWYYFHNGGEKYPTTTGLSIQRVSELIICSTQPAPTTPAAPVAGFSAEQTSGNAPLTVKFVDHSEHSPTSWAWDFDNDGMEDSTSASPSHTYDRPGVYTVRLRVRNTAGTDDEVKAGLIKVGPAPATEPRAETPGRNQPESAHLPVVAVTGLVASAIGWMLHSRESRRGRRS